MSGIKWIGHSQCCSAFYLLQGTYTAKYTRYLRIPGSFASLPSLISQTTYGKLSQSEIKGVLQSPSLQLFYASSDAAEVMLVTWSGSDTLGFLLKTLHIQPVTKQRIQLCLWRPRPIPMLMDYCCLLCLCIIHGLSCKQCCKNLGSLLQSSYPSS